MKPIRFERNELDHLAVMELLRDYRYPRDRLTVLLREGVLVRVKKGIYVPGEAWRQGPFSPEILANMIYGPSYVSLDYALSSYGLIPERVMTFTSVTAGKNKLFHTPVGDFSYAAAPLPYYSLGIDRVELSDGRGYLMASPEKALCDRLYREKVFTKKCELREFLTENLRISWDDLEKLDRKKVRAIAESSCKPNLRLLFTLLEGER